MSGFGPDNFDGCTDSDCSVGDSQSFCCGCHWSVEEMQALYETHGAYCSESDEETEDEEPFDGVYSHDVRRRDYRKTGSTQKCHINNLRLRMFYTIPDYQQDKIDGAVAKETIKKIDFRGNYAKALKFETESPQTFRFGKRASIMSKSIPRRLEQIRIRSWCYDSAYLLLDGKRTIAVDCNKWVDIKGNYENYKILRFVLGGRCEKTVVPTRTSSLQNFAFSSAAPISHIVCPAGPRLIRVSYDHINKKEPKFWTLQKSSDGHYYHNMKTSNVLIHCKYDCEVVTKNYSVQDKFSNRVVGQRQHIDTFFHTETNVKIERIQISNAEKIPDFIEYKRSESDTVMKVQSKKFYLDGNQIVFCPPIEANLVFEGELQFESINGEKLVRSVRDIAHIGHSDRPPKNVFETGPKKPGYEKRRRSLAIGKTSRNHSRRRLDDFAVA